MAKDIASRINVVINLSILGLLIYLAVMVKEIHTEMVNPEGYMKPATFELQQKINSKREMQDKVVTLLNNALDNAIKKSEEQ